MVYEEIEKVDFWVKAWDQANRAPTNRSQRQASTPTERDERALARWNRRAESYARDSSGRTYLEMQKTVFEFLDFCGVEIEGADVLDLGCGPGNYTIALAQKAAHVWALDPAEGMLDILKDRAVVAGVKNITYVPQAWEDIDLKKETWIGKFDLVFASMTPGIHNQDTLDKLIAASRGYCYVSRFAGRRRNSLQEKLWPMLSQEPDPWSNPGMDIVYPLNLLYVMGYFPFLRFINSKWLHQEQVETTTEKLLNWLDGFLDVTEKMAANVREFVVGEAVEGVVREEGQANMGLMVWRV